MSKVKKILTSPVTTMAAFAAAAGLLLFSSVGGARAALTYYSETYTSRVQMYDIGITLMEKNDLDKEERAVSWRNYDDAGGGTEDINKEKDGVGVLFQNMEKEKEEEKKFLEPGKRYTEELRIHNTGTINQYVRVSIYKYWLEKKTDGDTSEERWEKSLTMSPEWIRLNLVNEDVWLEDTAARTEERTVLYYNQVLPTGAYTHLFADSLIIDGKVAAIASQKEEKDGDRTKIITTYEYDGAKFCIEVKADAVQEHNVADAIWSSWGRRVRVDGGVLELVD